MGVELGAGPASLPACRTVAAVAQTFDPLDRRRNADVEASRGLARRLTQSIGAWGRDHGARFAYLQVVATNAAALPLYADLGFETVYRYAYRVS